MEPGAHWFCSVINHGWLLAPEVLSQSGCMKARVPFFGLQQTNTYQDKNVGPEIKVLKFGATYHQ